MGGYWSNYCETIVKVRIVRLKKNAICKIFSFYVRAEQKENQHGDKQTIDYIFS